MGEGGEQGGPVVVGHRANTPRWLRRHLRCTSMVEVDVYLRGNMLVAGHQLPASRPLLLRQRLARILENMHFTPSRPLPLLLSTLPPSARVMLDLKDRVSPRLVASVLEETEVEPERVILATRWHSDARSLHEEVGAPVLLSIDSRPANPLGLVEDAGAQGVSVRYSYLDPLFSRSLRSKGYLVAVWTVNTVDDFIYVKRLVDLVVSDNPCVLNTMSRRSRS